ncbi:macrolide ABC transporter ATP-binding protein [Candidatus Roizmanbacteria bacterium CG02_land_8_20_14_3_00_36_15]|uniref:Macrolide ABC transporter ATP-binding protein n=2 Tax=Candidatus Roizmaniibacteriota TaxID=1752723 RepID=A0A2M8KMR9_9BACT|nr:MAG: macrolide ABC transporter ATP-binding protein [Candidatus Roizmanbacteria bacterium CG03_land_8_20_14_0_80_36_21]PIV38197.1 MAG: macrolide ABC transporter ATP-binding protein [Candidatus Roizmanbacteria bacterium CG02_land_8_20_14_3_00_36_15]PIY69997.1 MAG: macrolide ABC transporter ATP-binding protein [Candidatus Roizmanbacteria bacterium CG_4_10_14_0_8_um_filter_36_36]PJA52526.1 MAG: macrolide ABC transporter ATP-binding protein [Candidatus Roizmanbacteria bacterium CG_4_9_14_3_um_filt
MIKVSHLSKIYTNADVKTVALDDVSFEITQGEFVSIMGPSGSGKSTLMHILGALDVPTSGDYLLDGQRIADLDDDQLADIRNKKIGFVFQAYNLLPRTTALKNIMVPMMYGGVDKKERIKRAEKYLKMVGLENRIYHTPNQLSGGQQQRVAIARALTMNPNVILADEPTGNIASSQAAEIMRILDELNQQGHTIVIITHEQEVAAYTKRVVHLRDGRIIDNHINGKRRRY